MGTCITVTGRMHSGFLLQVGQDPTSHVIRHKLQSHAKLSEHADWTVVRMVLIGQVLLGTLNPWPNVRIKIRCLAAARAIPI